MSPASNISTSEQSSTHKRQAILDFVVTLFLMTKMSFYSEDLHLWWPACIVTVQKWQWFAKVLIASTAILGPVLLFGLTRSDRRKSCSFIRSDRGSMVFIHYGQTGRNGAIQNDQPNQPTIPTGPRIAPFFYYHGRSTGETTVRLVSSVQSDRIKEQALMLDVVALTFRTINCHIAYSDDERSMRYKLWLVLIDLQGANQLR